MRFCKKLANLQVEVNDMLLILNIFLWLLGAYSVYYSFAGLGKDKTPIERLRNMVSDTIYIVIYVIMVIYALLYFIQYIIGIFLILYLLLALLFKLILHVF